MESHLEKLRQERIAREKARIEKLRELNLKKYSKNDDKLPKTSTSTVSILNKPKPDIIPVAASTKSKSDTIIKNKSPVKNHIRRPVTALASKSPGNKDILSKKIVATNNVKSTNKLSNKNNKEPAVLTKDKTVDAPKTTEIIYENNAEIVNPKEKLNYANQTTNKRTIHDAINNKPSKETNAESQNNEKNNKSKTTVPVKKLNKNINGTMIKDKNNLKIRHSTAAVSKVDNKQTKLSIPDTRKTMVPVSKQSSNSTKESVFERLYKPKPVLKKSIDNVKKLKTNPDYLKKVIKDSEMLANRRQTNFEQKITVRRSISAIHFKRIRKSEITNCVHKWASMGNNIDKEHLQDIDECESINEENVISAVKSERKRVKFQTPVPNSLNTPKPEELQHKLQNWLQKRGKCLDSYHHLQCFGIHHLSNIKSFDLDLPNFDGDDENKENIALDHDSDNESYSENNNDKGSLNDGNHIDVTEQNWRRASNITETSELNETCETTITSEPVHHIDELLLGALTDLTELLREGFDWELSARWLRAMRERFPRAADTAPYWECRAALEDRRGDLHATVECLERAMVKGTEQSIVEANLDSLLDKFMHLKISPNSGRKQMDPKLVDVKNVFKSTVIRFAVQQAKLSQSSGTPKFTVTPVRCSHRLSRNRTPLRVCTTIHQAKELGAEFKPNKALANSP